MKKGGFWIIFLSFVYIFLIEARCDIKYVNSPTFTINYRAKENVKLKTVELWVSRDGKKWDFYKEFPRKKPLKFFAPEDGVYYFKSRAIDVGGNKEPIPNNNTPSDFTVVLDRVPPKVLLLWPPESAILKVGEVLPLRWEVEEANPIPDGTILMYSSTPNGPWLPIVKRDLGGNITWKVPETGKIYFKIISTDKCGNTTEKLYGPFKVVAFQKPTQKICKTPTFSSPTKPVKKNSIKSQKSISPSIPASGPSNVGIGPAITNKSTFEIYYKVESPGCGLARVELWYTTNDGKTWRFYGCDSDLKSPMYFKAPGEGKYGFYMVFIDKAGNTSSLPHPGTVPLVSTLVDYTPPQINVRFVPNIQTFFPSQPIKIEWNTMDSFPKEDGVSIYYSVDNEKTWKPIIENTTSSGVYTWKIPLDVITKLNCKIKITATDKAGNTSCSFIGPVRIEPSNIPRGRIINIHPVTSAYLEISNNFTIPSNKNNLLLSSSQQKLFMQATIYRTRGEYAKAIACYKQLLKSRPSNPKVLNDLAIAYCGLGEYSKALSIFSNLQKQYPEEDSYPYQIGVIFHIRGYDAEAIHYLLQAVKLNPENEDALWLLGKIFFKLGKVEEAIKCWMKILKIDPSKSLRRAEAIEMIKRYKR